MQQTITKEYDGKTHIIAYGSHMLEIVGRVKLIEYSGYPDIPDSYQLHIVDTGAKMYLPKPTYSVDSYVFQ